MKKYVLFILLFSMIHPVFSQEPGDTTTSVYELSLEQLLNAKVTTVSKIQESSLKAPQPVIVITSDDIKNRGYTDVEQIFHDLPGFDISRGNGTEYSQIYQRGYRSNNTDRTLLLVDGVEQNDLWSNSAWISRQLPLSNIKQIEVIYGPSSTIYGANAFVGVVNIITKSADDCMADKQNIGINAQAGYGTWNTKYTDFSLFTKSSFVSLSFTGRVFTSDEMDLSGYEDWDYKLHDYDIGYYKEKLSTNNDEAAALARALDKKSYFYDENLNGKLPVYSNSTEDYYFKANLEFKNFTIGAEWWKIKEGYGAWYRDDYELGTEHNGNWVPQHTNVFVKFDTAVNEKLSISSFTRFKVHELSDDCKELYYVGYMNGGIGLNGLVDSSGNILSDPENPYWYVSWYHTYSQQLRSELNLNYKLSDNIHFNFGAEYRSSLVQGLYLVSSEPHPSETAPPPPIEGGNHFAINDYGLYSQMSYHITSNFSAVIGGRLDHNKVRASGGYGTVFNPKAGLIFMPSAFSFKAIYSEAFKDADNWTKYSTTPGRLLPNPNLEPEEVKNMELISSYKINENLFAEIAAFDAYYSNQVGTGDVTFINDDGVLVSTTQHQAMGSIHIQGIQFRTRWKSSQFSLYANYTYSNPYNTSEDDNVRIGDIASHKANLGAYYYLFKGLGVHCRMNYVGEKPTGESTTINENPLDEIKPYYIFHSSIHYEFYNGISFQLSARNLLDTEYFHPGVRSANGDYYAAKIPQNERNIMAKLLFEL